MKTLFCALAISVVAGPIQSAQAENTAATLLENVRHAYGKASGVLVETGTEKESGLTGRWEDIEDLRQGWTRQATDFSLIRISEVLNSTGDWRQDQSGGVHQLNSAFAKEHATTEEWLVKRGFLRPDLAGAKFEYQRQENSDGGLFDVAVATPAGGQAVELWFDNKTGLLAKSVWTMPISIDTIRYEDYRRVGGLMVPFKD